MQQSLTLKPNQAHQRSDASYKNLENQRMNNSPSLKARPFNKENRKLSMSQLQQMLDSKVSLPLLSLKEITSLYRGLKSVWSKQQSQPMMCNTQSIS